MAWNKTLEKLVVGNLLVVSCLPGCKEGGYLELKEHLEENPIGSQGRCSRGHMGYASHPSITGGHFSEKTGPPGSSPGASRLSFGKGSMETRRLQLHSLRLTSKQS